MASANDELQTLIDAKSAAMPQATVEIVDALLAAAIGIDASDLHLTPAADAMSAAWRLDGVLQTAARIPKEFAASVVTRLKVLARLLTYQTGVPQEGRIASTAADVEIRISTFPTIFGEKAVARFLRRGPQTLARVADLGLSARVAHSLRESLRQTSGAVIIAGPAGSGKTTTAYACLREIIAASRQERSVASLEDPVEVVVDGAAQSQVADAAGFDMATGLRSLMRQDPEVIFLGEIRDSDTARTALQAALTGQLIVTTFHAPDAAAALSRLADMGIPPYVLSSGVKAIVGQRLLRRTCECCKGLPSNATGGKPGCPACRHTGYRGRIVAAEMLSLEGAAIAAALRTNRDAATLRQAAASDGMTPLEEAARRLVADGVTNDAELIRIFGFAAQPTAE
jgi:type II secretory ATPase GspE/PulE/Tfp pilus assembly ATPase PilB-like protein